MTMVDREQLIALLAERTGMAEDRVDQQFMELINQIQQVETNRETFAIERFGTFKTVQDRLEFIPSDILTTEINNKYAGMKPIELIGAFKEPDGTDIPVAGYPPEVESQEAQETETSDAGGSESAEEIAPEAESVLPAEGTGEITPPEGQEERVVLPDQKEVVEDSGKQAAPVSATVKAEDHSEEATESLDKDPLGKAIVILAVILTLSVAGWLAYDLGLFGSGETGSDRSSPSSPPAEQQQNTGQQNAAVSNATSGEATDNTPFTDEQPDQPNEEGNETPASSVETETYGLYGGFNQDIDSGFYTIVVHSLRTMELAEEKEQGLIDEGFRTKINEADVNGRTYYRVGIGQFSTIQAAQAAVRELPESYRNNNFINRF